VKIIINIATGQNHKVHLLSLPLYIKTAAQILKIFIILIIIIKMKQKLIMLLMKIELIEKMWAQLLQVIIIIIKM
jgi:hypothetical protein